MGRTNLILLGLGVGACLLLSFGMQRLASIAPRRAPLVTESARFLGARRAGPVEVVADGDVVRLQVEVVAAAARRQVARDLGAACWRQLDQEREASEPRARGVKRLEIRLVVAGELRIACAVPPPWHLRATLEDLPLGKPQPVTAPPRATEAAGTPRVDGRSSSKPTVPR